MHSFIYPFVHPSIHVCVQTSIHSFSHLCIRSCHLIVDSYGVSCKSVQKPSDLGLSNPVGDSSPGLRSLPLIPAKGIRARSLIHPGENIIPGSPGDSHLGRSPRRGSYTGESPGGPQKIPMQTLLRSRAILPRRHTSRSTALGKAGGGAGSWPSVLTWHPARGTSEALLVTWLGFQTLLLLIRYATWTATRERNPCTLTHIHAHLLPSHTHMCSHTHTMSTYTHMVTLTHTHIISHTHILTSFPPSFIEI